MGVAAALMAQPEIVSSEPMLTLSPFSCVADWSSGGPIGESFQTVSELSADPAGNVMRSVLAGFDSIRVQQISAGGGSWQDSDGGGGDRNTATPCMVLEIIAYDDVM